MFPKKQYLIVKRVNDIALSAAGLVLSFLPLCIIGLIIKISSKGPVIHWSERIGENKKIFRMAKLRTMRTDAPVLANEELKEAENYIIFAGRFLRHYGIDEIPQLYNILKGDMSFVGPRPALYNYSELIDCRELKKLNSLKPGLTGLAQISGRNNLSIVQKTIMDEYYAKNMSIALDYKIIFLTAFYLFSSDVNLSFKAGKKSGIQEI